MTHPSTASIVRRTALLLALAGLMSACASGPTLPPSQALANAPMPTQWQAPLPHQGQPAQLVDWWRRFDDPLLLEMQQAAQQASPSLASARTRVEQARATLRSAGSALAPSLTGNLSASRGQTNRSFPLSNTYSGGLQAAWELDLFGGNRAAFEAAAARLEGAQAGWHQARVSVAAEVAGNYLGLRSCEALLAQAERDAASRAETARLTGLSAKVGFQSPANAALARASAAQGSSQQAAQAAQCDLNVKALVALTGLDEARLREKLSSRRARLPEAAPLQLTEVPAELLNQRPDLFMSAGELVAASADVSQAQAARWPRITLNGSIGAMRVETSASQLEGSTWSLGPLAVSVPLFDAGARRANVEAARARYDEAVVVYRAQLRSAVREVEEALVRLHSADARQPSLQSAVEDYQAAYRATDARYKGGLASLFDLEDARRAVLQAENSLIDLQRERVDAWITLYRAMGGGWEPPVAAPFAAATVPMGTGS